VSLQTVNFEDITALLLVRLHIQ